MVNKEILSMLSEVGVSLNPVQLSYISQQSIKQCSCLTLDTSAGFGYLIIFF